MAAAAQAPLPVPAPTPAKFATLFGDVSKDPTRGNVDALLAPFKHDLINPANNTDTSVIRNKVATTGAQRQLIAATVVSGGRSRLYILPHRWDDGLTGNNPSLDAKFFAFEGELINNTGHTVELDATLFNLINNTQNVPTPQSIVTALAADATITMMGPYANGDANIEVVKTRRICPVPHFIAGLWLAHPDGITIRHFWTVVYPQIVAAQLETSCTPLIELMQLAITSTGGQGDPSIIDTARPTAPLRNEALINHQLATLHLHFPQLRPDAIVQQSNLIATGIGVIAQQQRDQYEEIKHEKEKAKASTVEKMFGEGNFRRLLRMLQVLNEAQLVDMCPIYKELAESPKAQRLSVLQSAIDTLLTERGLKYLSVVLSPVHFANLITLRWHRISEDSLGSGFLGNPYLFGSTDDEYQQALNVQAEYVQAGDSAASNSDMKEMLKLSINLPLENDSGENLKRLEVVCSVLLPEGHSFLKYVREHLAAFDGFGTKWKGVELSTPSHQAAKGVYHLQHFALRSSIFWRDQAMTSTAVSLPSPTEMMTDIELGKSWEPVFSASLRACLKLDSFCRLTAATLQSDFGGDNLTVTTTGTSGGSVISGLTGGSVSALEAYLRQLAASGGGGPPPSSGGEAGGGGRGRGTGRDRDEDPPDNPSFNEHLFGEYKRRRVNGRPVRSREIRVKIARGELPALPNSKVDGSPMCLAWHTKGTCSTGCPRAADHVPYTTSEYEPLVQWCSTNYPQSE